MNNQPRFTRVNWNAIAFFGRNSKRTCSYCGLSTEGRKHEECKAGKRAEKELKKVLAQP